MSDIERPTWAYMQKMKIAAYDAGEMHVALYWQNEQIMKKLSDILFSNREHYVQS